jgi:Glycosyltransferase family 87
MTTVTRNENTPVSSWQYVMLAVAVLVLFVANIVVTHNYFTTLAPGGNDSIARYYGTQAWLFDGLNPYSEEASQRGQIASYGRLANDTGEDKTHFYYPFYVVLFYIPVVWLDWNWARAVGMVVLEVSLVSTTIFSARAFRWSPPPWLMAVTVIWSVVFYHGARTVILWQFAGLVAALIAISLWAIKTRRDVLAGICLALATVKPQMMFIIVPMIGLWCLSARRWRLAGSLAVSMMVLLGISFLLVPSWLTDMLAQLQVYSSFTEIGSPMNIITHIIFPALGDSVEWVINFLLLGWLFWEWWQVMRGDTGRFDWVIALALVITNMVALRTATTNYVMMIPTLIYLFMLAAHRWKTKANALIVAVEIILFAGLWMLFVFTVIGRAEQPAMYLPLPFLLLVWLIFTRNEAPTVVMR